MPKAVPATHQDRSMRVQVDRSAGQEAQASAIKALVSRAQTSAVYQSARKSYELRLIDRQGNTYLELHYRNFASRASSFLKGVLTGTRANRTEARESARSAAADFHAGLAASKAAQDAGLNLLRQHVRASRGVDPLALAVLDEDRAAVDRDVKSAMRKVRTYLQGDQATMAKLVASEARDLSIYAPGMRLMKKSVPDVLQSWDEKWTLEKTSGLLLDLGLNATRPASDAAEPETLARPDLEEGLFNEHLSESKLAAKSGSLQQSQWVKEFVPAGSKVQAGASATTLRLLELLSRTPGITGPEVEAVMNGITKYWAGSFIKQVRGEFHTTAEVWASYNHFLESQRIPRELTALVPQSKGMIERLAKDEEGQAQLLQMHANMRHARAEGLAAEGATLVRAQLAELEAQLPLREAVMLHLPPGPQILVDMAPDSEQVTSLLESMRSEMSRRREALQPPVSAEVDEALNQLRAISSGRALLAHEFPPLKGHIDMLPPSFDERLDKIASSGIELGAHDQKSASSKMETQLRELHTSLPTKEAAIYLLPRALMALRPLLEKVPPKGYESEMRAVVRSLNSSSWFDTDLNAGVKASLKKLAEVLPARIHLWATFPEYQQRLDHLESQGAGSRLDELANDVFVRAKQGLEVDSHLSKTLGELERQVDVARQPDEPMPAAPPQPHPAPNLSSGN
jgi:hypothetical protein